jgi:hypothetical protein
MIVSSEEMIEGDDEPQPSTSGAASKSDPDFVLPDPKAKVKTEDFTLKLNKTEWIKKLVPPADRARMSAADLFFFCATTIQAGGGDLDEIHLSTEGIRQLRIEAEKENADVIRVN